MDENKRPGLPSRIEQAGMRPPGIVGGREAFSHDSQPRRNPGRPKGSRNKMGSDLMILVMQAATETGFIRKDEKTGEMIGTGEEGALGYLKWAAIHKADRFIALMARVAPKHVFADVTHRTAMTSEEIEAELRERGLPVELLEHLRNVPEELDFDEDPDENKQPGSPSRIEQAGMRPPSIVGGREAFSHNSQPRRNPVRPKGSRNKMGSDLMTLVTQAATEIGFIRKDKKTGEMIGTGEEGALGYLKWAAIHKADRFIALMARMAPKHCFADVTHRTAMTSEEIEAEMRERGLPVDILPFLLNPEDEVLDPGEDPDPYGLMKNVTPASTNGSGEASGDTGNDTAPAAGPNRPPLR